MRDVTNGLSHPKVIEAHEFMRDGRLSRREFVRIAALLGVAAPLAYRVAGLEPAFAQVANSPFPADDAKAKKGGILRVAMQVQEVIDPATFQWVEMGNQARHTLEYLAMTGPDNITRPMLAESWEASSDLKTWTFRIRKNVMWHNGDMLTAEHVRASFARALDPDIGAGGVVGLSTFAAMLREEGGKRVLIPGALEATDEHTLVMRLQKPVLSVPEDCYNYPTAIVHPSFEPPLASRPIGTGPFTISELEVGDKCVLKRVTRTTDGAPFTYWGGEVYLDEIHYYNYDEDDQLTALASGDVDAVYELSSEQMDLAKALPGRILAAKTAQTLVCRMQISQAPFDNPKVRAAVTLSCDNPTLKKLVYPDGGSVGENHHVAEIHPEYFKLPPLRRDPAGAKALLAEAGYPDGIDLTIHVSETDGLWHRTLCEAMRDQMAPAGIRLKIQMMPGEVFWREWTKLPFAAVAWTHRPLGTMCLSLGYRSGVPWNDTHYASAEFDAALDSAEATLDVVERRAKMEVVERMLQEANLMVQPVFRPVYAMTTENVNGYPAHPTQYHQFNKVWLS
ncbi:MAG: ABC transporter substrate-binding protein [Rhizobiales bacterium]|nr:ABC transporter substrate-binding protein [Hyphomicrobiales bacterium]